ncbi:hypothetical protein J4E83_006842 [Alternaria metachromatica]|uniref:uncharacterized protein n=1 Tax=Alternaria metachromatica TaxID=283354 RepID=UPI0020C4A4F1|nr:uncharacterized protein J4E83_006842 [Alternaria metachromatica]KAI4615118.1 hypothetical protein J4E83_006842 [Alternaria metachromatica]
MVRNKNGKGRGYDNPKAEHNAISAKEKRHIENNTANFIIYPSMKDDYWASLDRLKRPAANEFYKDLIRYGDYPGGPKDPNKAEAPWPNKPAATIENPDTNHSGHDTQAQGIGAKIVSFGHVSSTSADSESSTPGAEASNEDTILEGANEANVASTVSINRPSREISKIQSIPRASLQDAPAINFQETSTPNSAPSPSTSRGGRIVPVNPGLSETLSNLKGASKYPLRTSLRTKPERGEVITNSFQMRINEKAVFAEYRILGIPVSESRAGKKRYMETAIQNVPFLNNNRRNFATDNADTIISWVNLHQYAGAHVMIGHPTTAVGAIYRLVDIVDRNTTAQLSLEYKRRIDFADLRSYANTSHADPSNYDPSAEEYALNTIMSKCIVHDNTTLHLNNHKFYVRNAFRDLVTSGQGAIAPLRSLRGYSYRVHATMGNILLNISPANSAFWRPLMVSEVLQHGRGTFGGDIEEAKRALKNVRVYVVYHRDSKDNRCKHPRCGNRANCTANNRANLPSLDDQHARLKTICGFGLACNQETFTWEHKDAQGNAIAAHRINVTVERYQYQQYGRTLRHPGSPAVNVGTNLAPTWFAPEDLRIVPDQIYAKIIPDAVATDFHNDACRPPAVIRSRVEREALSRIPITQVEGLVHCPHIRMSPHMIQIPSVRLPFPAILYQGNATNKVVDQRSGRWNLQNAKFLQRKAGNVSWKLIAGPNVDPRGDSVRRVETHFNAALRQYGVALNSRMEGQPLNLSNATEDDLSHTIRVYLQSRQDQQQPVPDIFVLLLSQKDQNLYSNFKYLADKVYVLQSICMIEANTKGNGIAQYMANIAMKANLKMAGINHSTPGLDKDLSNTLILGADCTHPGSGALAGSPSVAAVVGSLEANGGRFRGKLKLQRPKEEIIHGLGDFLADHFTAWYNFHGKFPEKVLYYRDGVSTSQYDDVVDVELAGIEEAFDNLVEAQKGVDVKPLKITAVIVTKRHSTRFFPRQKNDEMTNGNCKPGLLVDRSITSPYYTDFYLQSHNAIKGTARSAHYMVIRNDMGMSTDQLEDLTHKLNYTYVRATLGVSYAAPAYYADRLCERARCYLRRYYVPNNAARSATGNQLRNVETAVNQNRNATNANVPPRPRGHKKTDAEIQAEKTDAKDVADRMYNWLNPIAEKRLDDQRDDVAKNPAGDERQRHMLETMYWM